MKVPSTMAAVQGLQRPIAQFLLRTIIVVIGQIFGENEIEMSFVENDEVLQTFLLGEQSAIAATWQENGRL